MSCAREAESWSGTFASATVAAHVAVISGQMMQAAESKALAMVLPAVSAAASRRVEELQSADAAAQASVNAMPGEHMDWPGRGSLSGVVAVQRARGMTAKEGCRTTVAP